MAKVHLTERATSVTRICDGRYDDDVVVFGWSDHNFGCDCNRGIVFLVAGGMSNKDALGQVECGDDRFQVVKITDDSGEKIIYEGDPRDS